MLKIPMFHRFISMLPVLLIGLFFITIAVIRTTEYLPSASAEISTARDWVGLYPMATPPSTAVPCPSPSASTAYIDCISDLYENYDLAEREYPIDAKYMGNTSLVGTDCKIVPTTLTSPSPYTGYNTVPRPSGECFGITEGRSTLNPTGGLRVPISPAPEAKPGAYEIRMYANNSFLLLDKSAQAFWIPFSLTISPNSSGVDEEINAGTEFSAGGCSLSTPGQPRATISWPEIKGVKDLTLSRYSCGPTDVPFNINNCEEVPDFQEPIDSYEFTYLDNPEVQLINPPLQPSTYYRYRLDARANTYDSSDPDIQAGNFTSDEATINDTSGNILATSDCIPAWIQTTGGDVHSNQNINTSGAP